MLGTTLLVLRRMNPGRSVSDHASLTGLWFHCQSIFILSESNSSLDTISPPSYPATGLPITAGIFPFSSPSIGHPSFHVQGMRVSTRPHPPRSWKITPYQLPLPSSTIVPWAAYGNPPNVDSSITFFSYGPWILSARYTNWRRGLLLGQEIMMR